MKKPRYALFDADCLECSELGEIILRPRVRPFRENLRQLYEASAAHELPLVFTTCCSGRMLRPEQRPDVLFVPLDSRKQEWKAGIPFKRLIYLEKKAYGQPSLNFACRAFDMFSDNGNAGHLVKSLQVDEWIVFGNGLDLCVSSAVDGLLLHGQKVRFLPDCMCSGAKGYGNLGTEENRQAAFSRWREGGASESRLESFLNSLEQAA